MGGRKGKPRSSASKVVRQVDDGDVSLSPEWAREVKKRVRDIENPIRYIITSALSRRFVFYYNVSTDTFVVNNPEEGTLFKRREFAERLAEILGKGHTIVKFTTRKGVLKRLSAYQYRLGIGRRRRIKRRREA